MRVRQEQTAVDKQTTSWVLLPASGYVCLTLHGTAVCSKAVQRNHTTAS